MKERKNPEIQKQKQSITGNKRFIFGFIAVFTVLVCIVAGTKWVKAAEKTLSILEIDYENSRIIFSDANGDTKIYVSNSKKKTWEEFTPTVVTTNNGASGLEIDISWISSSANYTLTFKGDVSKEIGTVILPKWATNLKVSYKANAATPFTITNATGRTIQWRKSTISNWETWNMDTTSADLNYLTTNGVTLYFRLASESGKSATDVGKRASKEVKVKIPAKTAAPAISINPSAFTISLQSGMAYRNIIKNADGTIDTSQGWQEITATKKYDLAEFAADALYSSTTDTTSKKDVSIQFKKCSTASRQESKITTITIPAQKKMLETGEADPGAEISYTSTTSFLLSIKAASSTNPYEYTIINKDDYANIDYTKLSWSSLTSSKTVSINSKSAPEGSHILIRKKAVSSLGKEDFALPSQAKDITPSGIAYPSAATWGTATTISVPAGTINDGDYGKTATFTIYSPTKTTVSTINFADKYGNLVGRAECVSTVEKNKTTAKASDGSQDYIITTKITSTANLDSNPSVIGETLYANIILANGDEIKSDDTNGVILKLTDSTTINKPSDYEKTDFGKYYNSYMTKFERIYLSKESTDDTYFRFMVDFGTVDFSNSGTTTSLLIDKITYDAYELKQDTYTVASNPTKIAIHQAEENAYNNSSGNKDALIYYENYTDSDGNAARRAYVTIHVKDFENNASITNTNQELPFIITMNNGEVLSDQIYMTLLETATLNEAPIAWTITEGGLTESTVSNNYDQNGNPISSTTNPVNSYSLKLTKTDSNYNVSVTDVTWGGTSILYGATASGGTINITLSNKKINKLTVSDASTTKNIEIHLSNGFVISNGCKLTILKAAANPTN